MRYVYKHTTDTSEPRTQLVAECFGSFHLIGLRLGDEALIEYLRELLVGFLRCSARHRAVIFIS
jgi:hypothetical protein